MTDSTNSNKQPKENNSFIPVILLVVSAIVIIATFYEDEAKEILTTGTSQTESVAQSDQAASTQVDAIHGADSQTPATDNDDTEESASANVLTLKTTAAAESLHTKEAPMDATNTTELNASEIKIAQSDTTLVTEGNGNGNNSANGSAGLDTVITKTDDEGQSNEESAVTSASVNTETAASEPKETSLNVTQNTASNTATTRQNSVQRMPMPPHAHQTTHNATQAHPINMPTAQYAQRYMPRQRYQGMMPQAPKAYNAPRQPPAHPQMNMAQHKEASMSYQEKMEQRRQAMMKTMQAQRLENNARIQQQLKNQAKFLAEMKQMQKIAFQRAEESRRQTMKKIQEINQRYRHLQHQVDKLKTESRIRPDSNATSTPLTQ